MAKKKPQTTEPEELEAEATVLEPPPAQPEPAATKPNEFEPTRYQQVQDEMRAKGVEPVRAENREVERQLNHDELERLKDQIVEHHNEADRIEEEKKAANAKLGAEQKSHEAASALLRQKLKEGKETSDRLVMVGIDPKLKLRRVFDVETGEEITQEPLKAEDLQTDMGIGGAKASAREEPQKPARPVNEVAPGVIGVGYEEAKPNKHGVELGDDHLHSSVVNEVFDQLDEAMAGARAPMQHETLQDVVALIETVYGTMDNGQDVLVISTTNGLNMVCRDAEMFDTIQEISHKNTYAKMKVKKVGVETPTILEIEESDYSPEGGDEPEDLPLPKGVEVGDVE